MSVLENPVIPIVVRWSMRERSLRVENRRAPDSVRADRLDHAERACERLGELIEPCLRRMLNRAMNDNSASILTRELQSLADGVSSEVDAPVEQRDR